MFRSGPFRYFQSLVSDPFSAVLVLSSDSIFHIFGVSYNNRFHNFFFPSPLRSVPVFPYPNIERFYFSSCLFELFIFPILMFLIIF